MAFVYSATSGPQAAHIGSKGPCPGYPAQAMFALGRHLLSAAARDVSCRSNSFSW